MSFSNHQRPAIDTRTQHWNHLEHHLAIIRLQFTLGEALSTGIDFTSPINQHAMSPTYTQTRIYESIEEDHQMKPYCFTSFEVQHALTKTLHKSNQRNTSTIPLPFRLLYHKQQTSKHQAAHPTSPHPTHPVTVKSPRRPAASKLQLS